LASTQAKFKAALAESSGVTGGYTVPPDFYQQILLIAGEEATFRQFAFVQPMASATMQFPFLDITTVQPAIESFTTAFDKRVSGGILPACTHWAGNSCRPHVLPMPRARHLSFGGQTHENPIPTHTS